MNSTEGTSATAVGGSALSEGLGPLPEADVMWEDGKDQWGYADYSHAYSAEAMRAYAMAEVQSAVVAMMSRCQGKVHEGCAYLGHCGMVCIKCGQVA